MTLSTSKDRGTKSLSRYRQRKLANGEEPNPEYEAMMFLTEEQQKLEQEYDPEWQEYNLEYDLRSTQWILDKARSSEVYAQNIYAALCNIQWQRIDVMPILQDQWWSCTWRSAGGIVADMLGKGDYLDWYCSGIRESKVLSDAEFDIQTESERQRYLELKEYVPEGVVTEEVSADFKLLGWQWSEWPEKD
jgi:hypothetical protein